jgi:hypothetical protein
MRDERGRYISTGMETYIQDLEAAASAEVWESVEYRHIFTPEARPLRPDYATICEKWRYFYDDDCATDDGYEYEICRRKKEANQ